MAQTATSTATTRQIAPLNLNLPISLGSSGNDGATQSNTATSDSKAADTNGSTQSVHQLGLLG